MSESDYTHDDVRTCELCKLQTNHWKKCFERDCDMIMCNNCLDCVDCPYGGFGYINLTCDKCSVVVCPNHMIFCRECAINDCYDNIVHTCSNCDTDVKFVGCERHIWTSCAKEHENKGCGICRNEDYYTRQVKERVYLKKPSSESKNQTLCTFSVSKRIVEQLFTNLPSWVERKVFTDELASYIEQDVITARKNNDVVNLDRQWGVLCPLVSDFVDLGANGGMYGKYQEDHLKYNPWNGMHVTHSNGM